MTTEPLSPAERAALAALAWREHWHERIAGGAHPVQPCDVLLLAQLDEIYGPKAKHAGADGACPDYGSKLDPCPPGCASGTCVAAVRAEPAEERQVLVAQLEEREWVPRTMEDVRQGDTVRLPAAPERVATVLFALPLDWHVKQGARSWVWKGATYWDDAPLDHRLIGMRLDYEGVPLDNDGRPTLLQLPPDMPVEIHLTASELAAIEALGWSNRVRMEA